MKKVIDSITMDFDPKEVNDDIIDELQCAVNAVLLERGFTPRGAIKTSNAIIHWWKVTCDGYTEPFASRSWNAIANFLAHNIGFDYNIEGQYTEEIPNELAVIAEDKGATQGWKIARTPFKYRIGLVDAVVELPKDIDIEYDDLTTAYNAICEFVHRYDGVKQVDGRVMDNEGNDVDYCSSIM